MSIFSSPIFPVPLIFTMNSRCRGGGGWLAPTRPTGRLWQCLLVAMMGMAAGVTWGGVPPVAATATVTGKPALRRYYLSAESHTWDFTPSGINRCSGRPFAGVLEKLTTEAGPGGQHGSVYVKAHFVAYTDDTFSTPAAVDAQLGVVGPALYAAVGDDLHVTLRNQLDYPIDLQVGGLATTADTAAVAPGATLEYGFTVGAAAAPPPAGHRGGYVPSMMHVYGSEVNMSHVIAGLYGPLVVTRREDADADGKPAGIVWRGQGGRAGAPLLGQKAASSYSTGGGMRGGEETVDQDEGSLSQRHRAPFAVEERPF